MPSLSLSAVQKQYFFAANLDGTQDITIDTLSDGTVDSWAVSLSHTEATSFKGLMQGFGHFIPEVIGVDDEDDIGNNNNTQTQPVRRSLLETEKVSHKTHKLKNLGTRQAPGPWDSEPRPWDKAIVSQPQGYPVPFWNRLYTYTYVRENAVAPGESSRVYILDTGLDLTHPEFASRARVRGSTDPNNYNVQWIFADHDPREAVYDRDWNSVSYKTSWLDPNDPYGPRNPQTGFLEAYTDFTGHGTGVTSLIVGDNMGLALAAYVTIVKLVNYTSGPLQGKATLYSIRSTLRKTYNDIITRKSYGETSFVINMPVGAQTGDFPYPGSRETFQAVCAEFLQAFEALDVTLVFASGNGAVIGDPVRTPQKTCALNPVD